MLVILGEISSIQVMNRIIYLFIIFIGYFYSSCGDMSEINTGDEINIEGQTIELKFPRVQKVEHGEHFIIDDQIFYHNAYKDTKLIDGAKELKITEPSFKKIDLFCSVNVPYVAPNKEFPENISSNQIALDLAYRLIQIKDKEGQSIYSIKEGPILNFEGRVILSRRDGKEITIKKSKETALLALKIE